MILKSSHQPSRIAADLRTLALAVGVCLVLTLLPLFLWFLRGDDGSQYVLWYGYLDKRWQAALYFVWVLGLPLAFLLVRSIQAQRAARTFKASDSATSTATSQNKTRSLKHVAVAMAMLAFAWYLWGPPWGGAALGGSVDIHESVNYKGVQAILTGSTPYIDAASSQYGPLTQLLLSQWLQHVGPLSVEGFRNADLLRHISGIAFYVVVSFTFLKTKQAVAACLTAMLIFPTFSIFQLIDTGPAGFWGWGNVWRYAGLYLLALGIPTLTRLGKERSRTLAFGLLGAVWAVTSLLSQENLIGGGLVIVAINVGLVLGRRVSWVAAARNSLCLLCGALAVWIAYLVPYLTVGKAGTFLSNYFLIPRAVSSGYSNTIWERSSYDTLFYLTPLVTLSIGLIVVAAATRAVNRPNEPNTLNRTGSSSDWTTIFGVFCGAAIAQAGVLSRSDSSHLINSFALYPFLIALFLVWVLEQRIILTPWSRAATAVIIGGLALVSLQIATGWDARPSMLAQRLIAPIHARSMQAESLPQSPNPRMDTPYFAQTNAVSLSGESPKQVDELARSLKGYLGDRTTLVDPEMAYLFGNQLGYLYFVADLKPFELPYEDLSLAITRHLVQLNLDSVLDLDRPLCGLITTNPDAPFSQAALARMGRTESQAIPYHDRQVVAYRCL
jgi:hypothetical protein